MTRMRTISAAYKDLRERDPHTAVTMNGLRTMVIKGIIPSVRVGTKYLLNMEVLEEYFSSGYYGQT